MHKAELPFTSFDVVFYTLAFVVPGFVLSSVLSLFVGGRNDDNKITFVRFLTLSCVNYAIWAGPLYAMIRSGFLAKSPIRAAWIWGAVIFGTPVVLGVVGGLVSEKEWLRKALQRIGLNPAHLTPTGWEYKFSRRSHSYVIVTMKDGSEVAGLFASRSFASTGTPRDLYLEAVFTIPDDGGEWQRVIGTSGILIPGDEIRTLEFREGSLPQPHPKPTGFKVATSRIRRRTRVVLGRMLRKVCQNAKRKARRTGEPPTFAPADTDPQTGTKQRRDTEGTESSDRAGAE